MRSRKEKPIFRGLTIAAVGNLGGSAQWTDTNIARWVGLREGRFVRDGAGAGAGASVSMGAGKIIGVGNGEGTGAGGDAEVTHVVCTGEEFRRRGRLVKAALKCPKTCHIVTLDWLEDSMLKGKRLDEELYSHLRALKRERERERKRLMVIKGLEKAVKEVNPNLYHLYRDHTFFQYEVVMTRDNEEAGIQGERYILSMFESNNDKPRLYWFVAKYYKKKGDTQAKIHRPSHAPGMFAREFALFQSFFRVKTGIAWAQRLVKEGTTDKRVFQYQPPTGGKPVGWVPIEHVPVEHVPAEHDPTETPSGVVVDKNVNTATPTQPSAVANANGNGGAIPMASPTIGTSSSAPNPHRQSPFFIPLAYSPRPQHGAQDQRTPDFSSRTAPTFGLLTGAISPSIVGLTGRDNAVCAL
ncbi:uncharacterized protein B0H64DRAFT_461274 [Chaetomium fimeti]|uniref:BRCT domain-containing protein n=1 Tax=Chaetomium fimeti TaxID=1854472 RepID=A0AAE0HGS9_9PEZI|nr:hypothetical protein B0H64DRAFT_461274 [Chaetomium fimeti]